MSITDLVRTGRLMTVAFAMSAIVAVIYCSTRLGMEPAVALAGAVAVPTAFFLMRKYPTVLLLGLLFVGNFKSVPAQGISLSDPTMIVLLLAAGAIVIDVLFSWAGARQWSLHDLLKGQQMGIACFVLLATVIAASLLYTAAPHYGNDKLLRFVTFAPLVFFAPLILLKEEKDLRQLIVAFFFLGLVLTSKELFEFLHPSEQILSGTADITRISSAQLIGMTLLIFLYSPLFRGLSTIVVSGVVLFLGVGLATCTARGPLLSVLIILTGYSLIAGTRRVAMPYRKLLPALMLLAISIGLAVTWVQQSPAGQGKAAEKRREIMAILEGASDPGGTAEERLEFYRSTISALREKPLSGWGVGGWPVFYYGYERPDYPHNIVLEIGAEEGTLGLTAFFLFMAAVVRASYRIWISTPEWAFPLPLLAFSFLCSMFSGDLNTRSLWLWSGTILAISRMSMSHANTSVRREPTLELA